MEKNFKEKKEKREGKKRRKEGRWEEIPKNL